MLVIWIASDTRNGEFTGELTLRGPDGERSYSLPDDTGAIPPFVATHAVIDGRITATRAAPTATNIALYEVPPLIYPEFGLWFNFIIDCPTGGSTHQEVVLPGSPAVNPSSEAPRFRC